MKLTILFFLALSSITLSSNANELVKGSKPPETASTKNIIDKKYTDSELIQMSSKGVYLACEKYHHAICPEHCLKQCVSSSPDGVTADCDGPGSCRSKPNGQKK
jgi:hypothetical protein